MRSEMVLKSQFERLRQYRPTSEAYDEFLLPDGGIRKHWLQVLNELSESEQLDLSERWQAANHLLRENGTNITGIEQEESTSRPWEIDLIPAVYSHAQWEEIRAGVSQRARLIESIIQDLYGPQKLLREGVIPPEVIFRNPEFERSFNSLPAKSSPLLIYGCELARSPSGDWWVLADRASAPAGLSYAIENRIVISNVLSEILHNSQICRLAPFFVKMQETLKRLSWRRRVNPSIVILTAGSESPFYFEDVFLARYLGYPLVEADDLTVRKQNVYLKTLEGLSVVDVIVRRHPDQNLDPLEISNSPQGIAGLLQSLRNKKVVITNGIEYGLLDSPAAMPFLRAACQYLLNEDLKLPSIATWWCGQEKPLEYVLSHFKEMVIKPAFSHSGSQEFIVSDLTENQREELQKRLLKNPHQYVAQEKIIRSTSPCWVENDMKTGHLALRTFAVKTRNNFDVMDGGLIRVQTTSGPMALSITAGEFSKDVWVRSEKPVAPVSLMKKMTQTPRLQRTTMKLPSRAADSLFWLGRYLERFEFAGRSIRKVTERLMSESAKQPVDDVMPLIYSLAKQGLIDESYGVEGFCPPREELELIWPKIIQSDDDNMRFSNLGREVRRLASSVRDRMSEDFWRAVTQMDRQLSILNITDEASLGTIQNDMNRLVTNSSAINGQIMDGLVHGPTRIFILIGRYLERARQLAFVIQESLKTINDNDVLSLVTLLDVCNSLMTYRSRYRASFSLLPVIDLVVTDPGNPRSIVFQFHELLKLVSTLPSRKRNPQRPPHVDLVKRTLFEIESILPAADTQIQWDVYRKKLDKTVAGMEERVKQITDMMTHTFFVHVGYRQQIDEIANK